MKIRICSHRDAVTVGQILKVGREPLSRRNRGPAHQYRNHWNLALQRRLDLDADKIPWVIEPGLAFTAPFLYPLSPDHREEHLAFGHLCVQKSAKIDTKGN